MSAVARLTQEFGITAEEAASIVQRLKANSRPTPLLGVFVNRREGRIPIAYYIIETLGRGTFGDVFSASLDGSHTPSVVIKRIAFPEDGNEVIERVAEDSPPARAAVFGIPADFLRWSFPFGEPEPQPEPSPSLEQVDLEREFRISTVIRRRLGNEFCKERIVCATSRFYSASRRHGFIVFPYRAVKPFGVYVAMYVHTKMRQLQINALGAGLVVDEVQLQRKGTPRALELLDELRKLQFIAISLFRELIYTVALLHGKNIFHKDINPSNIIVTADGRPLLIDFGIACASGLSGDAEFIDRDARFLRCRAVYETTQDYEDPLASTTNLTLESARVDAYAKFDTYSLAKVGQLIFDPTLLEPNGVNRYYPVIAQTPLMPRGLFDLLVSMTGESGYRPNLLSWDRGAEHDLRLTPEQRRNRIDRLVMRTTAANAVAEFNRIFQRWGELAERR